MPAFFLLLINHCIQPLSYYTSSTISSSCHVFLKAACKTTKIYTPPPSHHPSFPCVSVADPGSVTMGKIYPSPACLAPSPPPQPKLSFFTCRAIPLSSSQSLKHVSVKANFLRAVDKATAAAFSEASGLSVYLQECGREEQATEGSRRRRRKRGKELGRGRRWWSPRRLGYVTRGAVLLKEKGGAELSAVPWRAAGRPQAEILLGSARGRSPSSSRSGCCGARCCYLCFILLQG